RGRGGRPGERRDELPGDLRRADDPDESDGRSGRARSKDEMSNQTSDANTSGFFDAMNRSALAVSQKAAGACVVGLLGFLALFAVAAVFFVTENFFIALLLVSLALLVYATGLDVGKLLLSS